MGQEKQETSKTITLSSRARCAKGTTNLLGNFAPILLDKVAKRCLVYSRQLSRNRGRAKTRHTHLSITPKHVQRPSFPVAPSLQGLPHTLQDTATLRGWIQSLKMPPFFRPFRTALTPFKHFRLLSISIETVL